VEKPRLYRAIAVTQLKMWIMHRNTSILATVSSG